MEQLKYLSNTTVDKLRDDIPKNIDRYRSGDFVDLMSEGDWSIELPYDVDLGKLSQLDPSNGSEAQIKNSELVWEALQGLTPALACEEGIWTRLTHVECLEFSRARWLSHGMDDESLSKSVALHFFARTRTQWRDDNAISRLWWNAYIAHQVTTSGASGSLQFLLRQADARSNIVERAMTGIRLPLVAGMTRLVVTHPWFIESEDTFRSFMRSLNRLGGGIVFETMSHSEIDEFLVECAMRAGMPANAGGPSSVKGNSIAAVA